MHSRVANQVVEALTDAVRVDGLACEGPLRVAAATLSRAVGDEISATTVVGVLGADDIRAFETLVAQIADEFEFDARVRLHVGTFSVRFSRRSPEVFDAPAREGPRSRRPHLVERLAVGIQHLMSGSARGARPRGNVQLEVIESPFRTLKGPLLAYIDAVQAAHPEDTLLVLLPEYIPGHWWEHLLHGQMALRLKASLLSHPRIVVANVPYHLAMAA